MNLKTFFNEKNSSDTQNTSSLYCFIKTGIYILSTVCIASIAIAFVMSGTQKSTSRQAMSSTISKKKLPIYCVDTDKPQIALSFDAAWGNIILMKEQIYEN